MERLVPTRPLPAQAYVPGRGLHPRIAARAAAGGRAPPEPAAPSAGSEAWWEEHRYAADLFNQRFFWEAHEAWEGLWRAAGRGTPRGDALQGLILLAAALLKDSMGQATSAARLAAAAEDRLRGAARDPAFADGTVLGLDAGEALRRLAAWRADPRSAPFPELRPQPPREGP